MSIDISGSNEQLKLKGILNSIVQALGEIESLQTDVKEYLKSIKEEFAIKPSKVRKALKALQKGNLPELKEELDDIETLIDINNKVTPRGEAE